MSGERHGGGMFPASAGDRGWRRRERDLAARVESMCADAFEALGERYRTTRTDGATRAGGGSHLGASHLGASHLGASHLGAFDVAPPPWDLVTALAETCVDRLRHLDDPTGSTARRLSGIVLDLHELGLDLSHHELEQRARRLSACSAALRRLRTLPSSADLLDQACRELVDRCGFSRAVLSRVEHGIWRPWMGYFSDSNEFQSWFAGWVDQPVPLYDQAPEAALVANRRPAVVYDTASAAVYRPIIIDSGRSNSYVVAPVLRGIEVVGLLHADYYPSSRRVDDFDREVLWSFAEGFSHTFERLVFMDRLRTQRDQVREILSTAVRSMDDLCDTSIDLSPQAAVGAMPRAGTRPGTLATTRPTTELTAREAEVFELMVAGATNGAIAETLVIAEDTVKSHVKHILRKLGVANRSQAIAGSLVAGYPAGR